MNSFVLFHSRENHDDKIEAYNLIGNIVVQDERFI